MTAVMLPRAQRLTTAEFAQVFAQSRVLRHPLMILRAHRRISQGTVFTDGAQARAAFVVAKKLGKATVRNRVRRRIRECYRLQGWHAEPRLAGFDLIFMATAAALTADRAQLDAALAQLLRRAAPRD